MDKERRITAEVACLTSNLDTEAEDAAVRPDIFNYADTFEYLRSRSKYIR